MEFSAAVNGLSPLGSLCSVTISTQSTDRVIVQELEGTALVSDHSFDVTVPKLPVQ